MTLRQRINATALISTPADGGVESANNPPHAARQPDLRCIRAARVALGWVVLFVGFHIYWFSGGSFVSPGKLPGLMQHSLLGWVIEVLQGGPWVLGFLVPLAISRGWARGRLVKPVAVLVWVGAVILTLRGGPGLIDDVVRTAGVRTGISGISTKSATGTSHLTWSWWAIDAYFLAGGMIFTWLAVRYRDHRRWLPGKAQHHHRVDDIDMPGLDRATSDVS